MSKWLTVDLPGGVHVIPLDDIILHSESSSCTCAPRVSLVPACDVVVCSGGRHRAVQFVRHMIFHEAMDGRE